MTTARETEYAAYFEIHADGRQEFHRCQESTAEKLAACDSVVFACLLGLNDGCPGSIRMLKGDDLNRTHSRAATEMAQWIFEEGDQ